MPTLASTLDAAIRKAARQEVAAAVADLRKTIARLESAVRAQARRAGGRGPGRPGRKAAARGTAAADGPAMTPAEVKALRARLGMTQKAFADRVGVTHVAVYFWESGRTTARGRNLEALRKLAKGEGSAAAPKAARKGAAAPGRRSARGRAARG